MRAGVLRTEKRLFEQQTTQYSYVRQIAHLTGPKMVYAFFSHARRIG